MTNGNGNGNKTIIEPGVAKTFIESLQETLNRNIQNENLEAMKIELQLNQSNLELLEKAGGLGLYDPKRIEPLTVIEETGGAPISPLVIGLGFVALYYFTRRRR